MRIPVTAKCQELDCDEVVSGWFSATESSVSVSCPCGHKGSGSLGSGLTIGRLVMMRARYEYVRIQDYSLSIVLAAMAFESELARLHHKWKRIAAADAATYPSDQELDDLLRKYPNIANRINLVFSLLHSRGLEGFLEANAEVAKAIAANFPSLDIRDLAKSIQEKLFWRRNRILHLGYARYDAEDAMRCMNISELGMDMLEALDLERNKLGAIPSQEDAFPSLEQKIKSLADVRYELGMMAECALALFIPFAPAPPLLESLLLHARALRDFFEKSERSKIGGREQDDILSSDYGFPVADLGLPEKLRELLNKNLAHLCYARSGPVWRFDEFLPPLVKKGIEFSDHVLRGAGVRYIADDEQRRLWEHTEKSLRGYLAVTAP